MAIDTIIEGYVFEYWPRNNNLLLQQTDIAILKISITFNEDEYNTIVNGKRRYRLTPKIEQIVRAGTEHPLGYVDRNLEAVYAKTMTLMREQGILEGAIGKVVFTRLESALQRRECFARACKELINDYMDKKRCLN
ncbi:MAG: hypothetical protein QME12_02175 [Nanoarchaeota archaeon]|nr:hypothetical protein [Nanoarchaeota archaeon]